MPLPGFGRLSEPLSEQVKSRALPWTNHVWSALNQCLDISTRVSLATCYPVMQGPGSAGHTQLFDGKWLWLQFGAPDGILRQTSPQREDAPLLGPVGMQEESMGAGHSRDADNCSGRHLQSLKGLELKLLLHKVLLEERLLCPARPSASGAAGSTMLMAAARWRQRC